MANIIQENLYMLGWTLYLQYEAVNRMFKEKNHSEQLFFYDTFLKNASFS